MSVRLAAVLILCSATAGAVEFAGRARATAGTGLDTNPRRDFVSSDAGTPADLVLQGVANLSGVMEGERGRLSASYDVGARKFIRLYTEDTVIQSLSIDGVLWLGRAFGVGVSGRARDRRGANREYTDLQAELSLQFTPDPQLDFRIWATAHRFIFWSGFQASFWAPEGGLTARYRFNKRHSLTIGGNVSVRTFNSNRNPPPDEDPPPPPEVRKDNFFLVSGAYWYRGPVVFSLGYGFFDSSSNSLGWSLSQHRVTAVFGAPLFWRLMVMLEINARFNVYPGGLYIDPVILTLDESGENLSSGVLKLSRPFGDHFELEARYGFYYGRLPKNDFVYLRHVATLQLGVHF